MNTVREYVVVSDHNLDRFTKEVNSLIQQGWQPHAGMVIHQAKVESPEQFPPFIETKTFFNQAMVK